MVGFSFPSAVLKIDEDQNRTVRQIPKFECIKATDVVPCIIHQAKLKYSPFSRRSKQKGKLFQILDVVKRRAASSPGGGQVSGEMQMSDDEVRLAKEGGEPKK